MAFSPKFPQPKFDFLKKEKKNRGECPNCGGQATSFTKDDMIWKRSTQCPNTWALGGTSLLYKTGMDRLTFMRELNQEPELIAVSAERKRNMLDWEQDNTFLNSNTQRYIDFINETDEYPHEEND